jgi:serine protease Do
VAFLGIFATVVMTYAVWLAASGNRSERLGGPMAAQMRIGAPMAAGHQATPVGAITGAWTSPRGAVRTVAGGAANQSVWQQSVDAISTATPGGGIKFIGRPLAARAVAGNKAVDLQTAFQRAADLVRPSVVNVNAIRPRTLPLAQRNMKPGGLRFVNPFDGVPEKVIGQRAFETVGSGVIIDNRGYIITNRHIVRGASDIAVSRYKIPGEHLPAYLVAEDMRNDLALLKIGGGVTDLKAAKLADSSRAEVGSWVLAIGNPFGLDHTVTAGIISGRNRTITVDGLQHRGFLQTDAPINPGSSGGALVGLDGRVFGITTAIYAPTGVFSGAGFAIPSNRVGAFISRVLGPQANLPAGALVAQRQMAAAPHLWQDLSLGLAVTEMTSELARKLAFPQMGGVFVSTVVANSPATEAELAQRDIITAVNGAPVADSHALARMLSNLRGGQRVSLTVWRNGASKKLSLKAGRPAVR